MRWGTSKTILVLGALTHGGFLLFMSHYTHSSASKPGLPAAPPQFQRRTVDHQWRTLDMASSVSVSALASSSTLASASTADASPPFESDAMDAALRALSQPRGTAVAAPSSVRGFQSIGKKAAPPFVAATHPDAEIVDGGGVGSGSLRGRGVGSSSEAKEKPTIEAKEKPPPVVEPKPKKKQRADTLVDSWSGGPDLDDIIDPMVRRADVGALTDVVSVLCNTTKGNLQVEVFPAAWGSRGADRFLALLDAGLFETKVALTRAVKGFIIQFGTPGDPAWSSLHKGEFPSLKDDLQWMPIGPACGAKRQGMNTCKRHRKGWLSFAGGGANSRRLEMFVGLADTGHGGPPHEVPFGRVLRQSFPVLDALYTGYGEMAAFGGHAPPSGRIAKEGVGFLAVEFPLLDFVTGCQRVNHPWEHPH